MWILILEYHHKYDGVSVNPYRVKYLLSDRSILNYLGPTIFLDFDLGIVYTVYSRKCVRNDLNKANN